MHLYTFASKPAVMLQSLLNCSVVFLVHLCVLDVSSVHDITTASDGRLLSIWWFNPSQAFLVGNKHTGVWPDFSSSCIFEQ